MVGTANVGAQGQILVSAFCSFSNDVQFEVLVCPRAAAVVVECVSSDWAVEPQAGAGLRDVCRRLAGLPSVRLKPFHDPKPLNYYRRLVGDRRRIAAFPLRKDLVAPEPLVLGPPAAGRRVVLTLRTCDGVVDFR